MDEKKYRLISIVVCAIGIVLAIAGAVMLGIGVSKSNDASTCDTTTPLATTTTSATTTIPTTTSTITTTPPTVSTASTTTTAVIAATTTGTNQCQVINSVFFYVASSSATLTYAEPNTTAYTDLVNNITTQIQSAFVPLSTYALNSVGISYIQNAPAGGINFYSTLVFGQPIAASMVESNLNSTGFASTAYQNISTQCPCGCLVPPPPPTAVSTTVQPALSYPCNIFAYNRSVLFLIDVARPIESGLTMEMKQNTIRSYLTSLLPPGNAFGLLRMGIAVYYGTTAYAIHNYLCTDVSCWNETINLINFTTQNETSHNVTTALIYAFNEFSQQMMGAGASRSIIIVTDGYEFINDAGGYVAQQASQQLQSAGFQVSVLAATTSFYEQYYLHQISSPQVAQFPNFYPVSYYSQIAHLTVRDVTASWICQAPQLTTLPTIPTFVPQTFPTIPSTLSPTTVPATIGSTTSPLPCQLLDVLFLIDISQSIQIDASILRNITEFVVKTTWAVNALAVDARFGWITFNSKVWDNTNGFLSPSDFVNRVGNTTIGAGNTQFFLGFDASRELIRTNNRTGSKPVLIFLTDGQPNDGPNITMIRAVADDIRCHMGSEIIGLGVAQDDDGRQQICDSIGAFKCASVQSPCGNYLAHYYDVQTFGSLNASLIANNLDCAPPPTPCSFDIAFAIEVSEDVDDAGFFVEQRAVIETISYLQSTVGFYANRIGLVYFSSYQGMNGAEFNRSGILFDLNTLNATDAISQLRSFCPSPKGGASDIALGLNLTMQMLEGSSSIGNGQIVIVMGRGAYEQLINCCPDPYPYADMLKAHGAVMQGVVLGRANNPAIMQNLTGRPNIFPGAFDISQLGSNQSVCPITMNRALDMDNVTAVGIALAQPIKAFLDATFANSTCPLPAPTPCNIYMDIVIILRSFSTQDAWIKTISFIVNRLLPVLAGTDVGDANDRVARLAFVVYHDSDMHASFTFGDHNSQASYATAIQAEVYHQPDNSVPQLLSNAYQSAIDQFNAGARSYATRGVIVFSDFIDSTNDAVGMVTKYRTLRDQQLAIVLGIAVGSSVNFTGISTNSFPVPDADAFAATNRPISIILANRIAAAICAWPPPPPVTPPPTTPYCTPPTPSTIAPPTVAPAFVWPDITIVLDTSADLTTPGSNALNDRGFETMRTFLSHTLTQYKIGRDNTHVAIVTFDQSAKVVFHLSDYNDWNGLYQAIGQNWQYGPSGVHTADRNINAALTLVLNDIMLPRNGFRQGKLNYVWIFTTGPPADSGFQSQLIALSRIGARVQAIGLGNITDDYLHMFGYNSIVSPDYNNPLFGIANLQNNQLATYLYQTSTGSASPIPPLSRIYADIIVAIDVSTSSNAADFGMIKSFLTNWFALSTISASAAQIAIVTFDSNSTTTNVLLLNAGTSLQAVNNAISSMSYPSSPTDVNFGVAIQSLINTYLIDANGYRAQSTHTVFISSSPNITGDLSAVATLQNLSNVYFIALNTGRPTNIAQLVPPTNAFAVDSAAGLLTWSNSIDSGRTPIQDFFDRLANVQLSWIISNRQQLSTIQTDFMFLIDISQLSISDFDSLKTYLISFVSLFTIGQYDTQFGVILYADQAVNSGIALTASANLSALITQIQGLDLPVNFTLVDNGDIIYAYQRCDLLLNVNQGWRQGSTFVVVLASAANYVVYNATYQNSSVISIQSKAITYGIDLENQSSSYLTQFVRNHNVLSAPTDLNNASNDDMALRTFVASSYIDYVYPTAPPLSAVSADLIYVIDRSTLLAVESYLEIIGFLTNMAQNLTIGPNAVQMAVVMHNSNGVIAGAGFALNQYTDQASLVTAIQNLQYSAPTGDNTTDIVSAMDYVNSTVLNSTNGYRNQLAIVTFITTARSPSRPVNAATALVASLRARTAMFGFAYMTTVDTFRYLSQIIPSSDTQVFLVSSLDMSNAAISGPRGHQFFIVESYQKYVATHQVTTQTPAK